jgi:hypothetical protein
MTSSTSYSRYHLPSHSPPLPLFSLFHLALAPQNYRLHPHPNSPNFPNLLLEATPALFPLPFPFLLPMAHLANFAIRP